jgi:hypothetical protein
MYTCVCAGQTGSHVGFIQAQLLLTKFTGSDAPTYVRYFDFYLSVLKVDSIFPPTSNTGDLFWYRGSGNG